MREKSTQAPLWLLPQPRGGLPSIEQGHPRLATALAALALSALVPVFLFAAPESRWEPQSLFALLLSAGFVAGYHPTQTKGTLSFDAGFVVGLVGLALLGPLPGALFFAAPDIGRSFIGDQRLIAFLGNTASAGWACLAGAFALATLSSPPPLHNPDPAWYVALGAAGLALVATNWLLITVINLHDGTKVAVDLFPRAAVPILALLITGVATVFLYDQVGIPGLAPLVAAIVLPRVLATRFLRPRAVEELKPPEATALYARAMADVLRLGRDQKRILADAATHLGGSASLSRIDDFGQVMQTVLYCNEHWDGEGGFPRTVAGESIPIESRVLAVASAWSVLTAKGTRELSPGQALVELKARAGGEFDPRAVAAAARIVEDDTLSAPEPGRDRSEQVPR